MRRHPQTPAEPLKDVPHFVDEDPAPSVRLLRPQGHLCLRCHHNVVCKMSAAVDPQLGVVISHCLAFERARDRS